MPTPWIAEHAEKIAARAPRELEALVGVSSPSGDIRGADECMSVCAALVPAETEVERVPCSSPAHAGDFVARLRGTGTRRIVLLGHVDTVHPHAAHRALHADGDRLVGSGSIDMKGGVVLSLGVLRALAARKADFAEVALVLVCDEEWRTAPFVHAPLFAGWDACLCFEAGEQRDGAECVIVRRKGAATLRVAAEGRAAHSGSAPDRGRNALLALAAVSQAVATRHDPEGEHRLTAVPTILRAGEAFNVVPGHGELLCDLRADDAQAFQTVLDAIPPEHNGVRLDAQILRLWPGMDSRAHTDSALARASEALGSLVVGTSRGGASDASHFASVVPLTVDGLGPRGGAAHNPEEYVLTESFAPRAAVALALVDAVLAG